MNPSKIFQEQEKFGSESFIYYFLSDFLVLLNSNETDGMFQITGKKY